MNAQGKPRGTGFELRTDEHGVVRVAKGLFICADGQQKAAGEVLDRETALQEIALCLEQIAHCRSGERPAGGHRQPAGDVLSVVDAGEDISSAGKRHNTS